MAKFNKRPQYSISSSVAIRKGKYKQGPSFGLWINDGKGPMARGSVKENYLEELAAFLSKAAKNDLSVSFSLFKNKKKVEDDDEEEDDEEDEEEKDEEEDEEKEDDDEEEEKPAKRKSSKSTKSSGKSSGKAEKKSSKDWDFDDDDDD